MKNFSMGRNVLLSFMLAGSALAGPKPVPVAERYAQRCQRQATKRWNPQGSMLWGTLSSWTERTASSNRESVLVWASLDGLALASEGTTALEVEAGQLVGDGVIGSVLRGVDGNGQPAEVAICGAEPSPEDPGTVWYEIRAWNPVAQDWENPCMATGAAPNPRALVLAGSWDATGAHHAGARKITFACEAGALSKCAAWGYKPWASRNGQSLAEAHQACTRMARADYCGDGRSHTRENTAVDYYDRFGLAKLTTTVSPEWDPARATFEGGWDRDGATCLARMRDGRGAESILQECPGRFRASTADLGQGDRCVVQRATVKDPAAASVLRNRSISPHGQDKSQPVQTGQVRDGHGQEDVTLTGASAALGSQLRGCSLTKRWQPGACSAVDCGPDQDGIRDDRDRAAF